MSAMVSIRNDGPDSVDVMIGGTYKMTLARGQQTLFSTSRVLSFEPVRPMTPEEISMHTGVPVPKREPLGRFVEDV